MKFFLFICIFLPPPTFPSKFSRFNNGLWDFEELYKTESDDVYKKSGVDLDETDSNFEGKLKKLRVYYPVSMFLSG